MLFVSLVTLKAKSETTYNFLYTHLLTALKRLRDASNRQNKNIERLFVLINSERASVFWLIKIPEINFH